MGERIAVVEHFGIICGKISSDFRGKSLVLILRAALFLLWWRNSWVSSASGVALREFNPRSLVLTTPGPLGGKRLPFGTLSRRA